MDNRAILRRTLVMGFLLSMFAVGLVVGMHVGTSTTPEPMAMLFGGLIGIVCIVGSFIVTEAE